MDHLRPLQNVAPIPPILQRLTREKLEKRKKKPHYLTQTGNLERMSCITMHVR